MASPTAGVKLVGEKYVLWRRMTTKRRTCTILVIQILSTSAGHQENRQAIVITRADKAKSC